MPLEERIHEGSCHCDAVKWTCKAPSIIEAIQCNCSICKKKQNHHFIVAKENFQLLQGEDKLTYYRFNTGVAKHPFCSVCGVQSFYMPRSNPDSVAIMPHCIDSDTVKEVRYKSYDGQNWEQTIQTNQPVAYRS
uniref:CENP-V/GFA domain-containing protein n=1 Tax=Acrobeloides nanus TaxID=290746 RepID=A0A914BXS1_9BILA